MWDEPRYYKDDKPGKMIGAKTAEELKMCKDEKGEKMVQFILHGANPVEERVAYMSMTKELYEKMIPEPLRKCWEEGRSYLDEVADMDLTGNPNVVQDDKKRESCVEDK